MKEQTGIHLRQPHVGLNAMAHFARGIATVCSEICAKQRAVMTLPPIKDRLLLNPIMDLVCGMATVFRWICGEQHIITGCPTHP
jgi:hypothetical protein